MSSVLYDAPGPKSRARSRLISVVGTIILAGGLLALIVVLGLPKTSANGAVQPGLWDISRWDVFNDLLVWRTLGLGALATLRMAAVAAVFALVIGVLFSFGRLSASAWIRVPTTVLLEFFRGMPVLLMMLFILLVFSTGSFWAGVAALSVYNGAIIGEALRAGINALPRGQREAGLAIGLTPVATRFRIEFPQAFRQMLPIIIAQLVVLLKDTSLSFIVGYNELLRAGLNQLANFFGEQYKFSFFFIVLAIYLAMNLSLSWLARRIAKRTGPQAGSVTKDDSVSPIDPVQADPRALGAQSRSQGA
ncbi:amino acid ABC transporter permease [Cryobacterium sp. TMS1-20-1]|uniref:amino acid ABC transporter permease n=1 Tax=unclassified Cryobacterium TaxID=2649013 RepID=UPI001069FA02|nr:MULTISPECIES: amino acid ABC transporter permease [unclassified Cryobacterium]TFC78656.1 amino acid ABC transporter permease [Cryobacterium sp. TMS1-20-1]TFD23755.1 amino acid ABC transporter permease [Cryobacterium sp. TMS1-13-1]TFD54879.1 amino acid ABC transporter permease [Cryobacterium sp. Hh7]